uniref:Cell division protein FTSH n=1 Tax=Volvulina compacta TaxID=51721 RepID=A0A6C0RWT9_9CHLO|nr:cell division protein FTSH [Volvulina compacta]
MSKYIFQHQNIANNYNQKLNLQLREFLKNYKYSAKQLSLGTQEKLLKVNRPQEEQQKTTFKNTEPLSGVAQNIFLEQFGKTLRSSSTKDKKFFIWQNGTGAKAKIELGGTNSLRGIQTQLLCRNLSTGCKREPFNTLIHHNSVLLWQLDKSYLMAFKRQALLESYFKKIYKHNKGHKAAARSNSGMLGITWKPIPYDDLYFLFVVSKPTYNFLQTLLTKNLETVGQPNKKISQTNISAPDKPFWSFLNFWEPRREPIMFGCPNLSKRLAAQQQIGKIKLAREDESLFSNKHSNTNVSTDLTILQKIYFGCSTNMSSFWPYRLSSSQYIIEQPKDAKKIDWLASLTVRKTEDVNFWQKIRKSWLTIDQKILFNTISNKTFLSYWLIPLAGFAFITPNILSIRPVTIPAGSDFFWSTGQYCRAAKETYKDAPRGSAEVLTPILGSQKNPTKKLYWQHPIKSDQEMLLAGRAELVQVGSGSQKNKSQKVVKLHRSFTEHNDLIFKPSYKASWKLYKWDSQGNKSVKKGLNEATMLAGQSSQLHWIFFPFSGANKISWQTQSRAFRASPQENVKKDTLTPVMSRFLPAKQPIFCKDLASKNGQQSGVGCWTLGLFWEHRQSINPLYSTQFLNNTINFIASKKTINILKNLVKELRCSRPLLPKKSDQNILPNFCRAAQYNILTSKTYSSKNMSSKNMSSKNIATFRPTNWAKPTAYSQTQKISKHLVATHHINRRPIQDPLNNYKKSLDLINLNQKMVTKNKLTIACSLYTNKTLLSLILKYNNNIQTKLSGNRVAKQPERFSKVKQKINKIAFLYKAVKELQNDSFINKKLENKTILVSNFLTKQQFFRSTTVVKQKPIILKSPLIQAFQNVMLRTAVLPVPKGTVLPPLIKYSKLSDFSEKLRNKIFWLRPIDRFGQNSSLGYKGAFNETSVVIKNFANIFTGHAQDIYLSPIQPSIVEERKNGEVQGQAEVSTKEAIIKSTENNTNKAKINVAKSKVFLNRSAEPIGTISILLEHQKMFKSKASQISQRTKHALQKKRKAKKQRLETRRQKKRTRFFPRPNGLRYRMFLNFINQRKVSDIYLKNYKNLLLSSSQTNKLGMLNQADLRPAKFFSWMLDARKNITASRNYLNILKLKQYTKKIKKFKEKRQIILRDFKLKANYINFNNQKMNKLSQLDKNKNAFFRDLWIWSYNNTITNNNLCNIIASFLPKEVTKQPVLYNKTFLIPPTQITQLQKNRLFWVMGAQPLDTKTKDSQSKKLIQPAAKNLKFFGGGVPLNILRINWAINKTYNKRHTLWGNQKLRNQSKNNKTKYFEKQFITSWLRFFNHKNLNIFSKKIQSKIIQKKQKLNYLTNSTYNNNNDVSSGSSGASPHLLSKKSLLQRHNIFAKEEESLKVKDFKTFNDLSFLEFLAAEPSGSGQNLSKQSLTHILHANFVNSVYQPRTELINPKTFPASNIQENPIYYFQNNLLGSVKLCEALQKNLDFSKPRLYIANWTCSTTRFPVLLQSRDTITKQQDEFSFLQVNNIIKWWKTAHQQTKNIIKQQNAFFASETSEHFGINNFANIVYWPPYGERSGIRNQQKDFSILCTIVVHLCALISLVSISQVRCFVKFHLIFLSKFSNIFVTEHKTIANLYKVFPFSLRDATQLSRQAKEKNTVINIGNAKNTYWSLYGGRVDNTSSANPRSGLSRKHPLQGYLPSHPRGGYTEPKSSASSQLKGLSELESITKNLRNFTSPRQRKNISQIKLLTYFSLNLIKTHMCQKNLSIDPVLRSSSTIKLRSITRKNHFTKLNFITFKNVKLKPGSHARGTRSVSMHMEDNKLSSSQYVKHVKQPNEEILPKISFSSKKYWARMAAQNKILDRAAMSSKKFETLMIWRLNTSNPASIKLNNFYLDYKYKLKQSVFSFKKSARILLSTVFLNMFSILEKTLIRNISNFFEKPAEYTTTWIAFGFLVEWSSDIITIIPETVDIYIWNVFFKMTRTIPIISFFNSLHTQIPQHGPKEILVNSFKNFAGVPSGDLRELQTQPSGVGALKISVGDWPATADRLGILTISHLLHRRILYLFAILMDTISRPDTDLIVRQEKGTLFWDIWADFLVTAADYYNVNVPALSTFKAEQNRLIETISNNVSGPHAVDAREGTTLSLGRLSLWDKQPIEREKGIMPFVSQSFSQGSHIAGKSLKKIGKVRPSAFVKLDRSFTEPYEASGTNLLFYGKQSPICFFGSYRATQPGYAQDNIEQPIFYKDLASKNFGSKLSKTNFWLLPYIWEPQQGWHNSKAAVLLGQHKNTSVKLQRNPRFGHVGKIAEHSITQVDRWAVNQYITYQSYKNFNNSNGDLFIDFHVPKGFSHISTIKYNHILQQPIGTLVCQIYSGIFNKQVSKNILLVNINPRRVLAPESGPNNNLTQINQTDYNVLLIQALAGETELKIITDNANRYALVNRGFAIGIKLLRDVFFAIALNTPCIFLLEDIHAIGERRPMLISEYGDGNEQAMSQRDEIHEKNQVVYQLTRHAITDYKKPFKGDYSLTVPTNLYSLDLFLKKPTYSTSNLSLISYNNLTLKNKIKIPESKSSAISKSKPSLNKKRNQKQTKVGPRMGVASPFSVLLLKEEKKLKNNKIVEELSWTDLTGKLSETKSRITYSVRAKVAMLAELSLSNISAKLDMITDLLVIIDSVRSNKGFVVFATTDVPHVLDPALRRPGRFDETICLPNINTGCSQYINYDNDIHNMSQILKLQTAKSNTLAQPAANLFFSGQYNLPKNQKLAARQYIGRPHERQSFVNIPPTVNLKDYTTILSLSAPLMGLPENLDLNNALLSYTKKLKNHTKFRPCQNKNYIKPEKNKTNTSVALSGNQTTGYAQFYYTISTGEVGKALLNYYLNKVANMLAPPITTIKSINYLSLYGLKNKLILQLMYIFGGKISQLLMTKAPNQPPRVAKGYESSSFGSQILADFKTISAVSHEPQSLHYPLKKNKVELFERNPVQNPVSFLNNLGLAQDIKLATRIMLSFIHKRYLYIKNLIVPKLLSFTDGNILEEPPCPPFSSLLIPAKRFENYRRVFDDQFIGRRKIQTSLIFKQQNHAQLQKIKQLNKANIKLQNRDVNPTMEYFPMEAALQDSVVNKHSKHFSPLELRSQQPEQITNVNWYYQNLILKRHGQYLTNQWWNGQLSEHNAETVFLSDIDWRYSFIKQKQINFSKFKKIFTLVPTLTTKTQLSKQFEEIPRSEKNFAGRTPAKLQRAVDNLDVLLDFPDTDQFYNPRRRRWLLNKGYWSFWFNFDKVYSEEIISTMVLESIIQTYTYLHNNTELLDFMTSKYLSFAAFGHPISSSYCKADPANIGWLRSVENIEVNTKANYIGSSKEIKQEINIDKANFGKKAMALDLSKTELSTICEAVALATPAQKKFLLINGFKRF